MPISLPTDDDQPGDSGRPGGAANAATPRMTREQRVGLLGVMLGILLTAIMAWVGWLVFSSVTRARPAPVVRHLTNAEEMLAAATVSVSGKAFLSSATEDRRVEGSRPSGRMDAEYIRITGTLANSGSRDIRAIEGNIVFLTLFGDEIKSVTWSDEHGLKAGASKPFVTDVVYDDQIDSTQQLRKTKLADMKVRWDPHTIVFADGTLLRK